MSSNYFAPVVYVAHHPPRTMPAKSVGKVGLEQQ